ncbi:hypothetical protein GIB67_001211 [Kingdonia uniflora]|uniref:MORF/ORRM1/DAG-like MORF domain-containing protein n=1 Tax=Kingdonia uniflora TaxID=39325 RepID=A0A7J7LGJ2_9MAGN|nr:hypothetical protein GIB67_001211 [Kingdonia uniflora]
MTFKENQDVPSILNTNIYCSSHAPKLLNGVLNGSTSREFESQCVGQRGLGLSNIIGGERDCRDAIFQEGFESTSKSSSTDLSRRASAKDLKQELAAMEREIITLLVTSKQALKGLPDVLWVLPDSYLDVPNKDYGGDLFIDGKVIHRPQYRRDERPQHRIRPRPRYDRRRETMQVERREPMQRDNWGQERRDPTPQPSTTGGQDPYRRG